jgi:hypothetical protein
MLSKRKTCAGKLIVSTLLPRIIKKEYLPDLFKLGYSDYPVYTRKNLLKLYKGDMVIQGTFFNKQVSIYCKSNDTDINCEQAAKVIIAELTEFLS